MSELLRVDRAGWKTELPSIKEHFATLRRQATART